MKDRLSKSIKRLEKLKLIKDKKTRGFDKQLNSFEIKVFRELREKYDISIETNKNSEEFSSETDELSDDAKETLERIKKNEKFII
ncbi:MAG: hypothetical protein ACJ0GH_01965 [Alphaproteobacteria bacterium]